MFSTSMDKITFKINCTIEGNDFQKSSKNFIVNVQSFEPNNLNRNVFFSKMVNEKFSKDIFKKKSK